MSRTVRTAVLTISDRCFKNEAEDRSGPEVARLLEGLGWSPEHRGILPDDERVIAEHLATLADTGLSMIVTTGGSGLGPRDRTPEATRRVIDRHVPGLAELARARTAADTPTAYLSRGIAGLRGRCLILNLPGSVAGAREMLTAMADLLPHAMEVMLEDPGKGGAHGPRTGRGDASGRSLV